ncbi:threonine/serine exporter family protein [Paucibacter sp. O1-1]|nr:threonine/serine exporter family protein [Paucibacter sp. O1-1]MDA3830800.1 threonine/serine exporter family protein [Paucibacter sp. O1-1]
MKRLSSGQRTLQEALERLEDIANKPNPYGHKLTLLAFGTSAGAFAMLMGAIWHFGVLVSHARFY